MLVPCLPRCRCFWSCLHEDLAVLVQFWCSAQQAHFVRAEHKVFLVPLTLSTRCGRFAQGVTHSCLQGLLLVFAPLCSTACVAVCQVRVPCTRLETCMLRLETCMLPARIVCLFLLPGGAESYWLATQDSVR
jgi:hypothetical protein